MHIRIGPDFCGDCGKSHFEVLGKEVWSLDQLVLFWNLEDSCAADIRRYQGR